MKFLNKTAILRDINIRLSNIYTNNVEDTSEKIFSLLERYSPFIDNDDSGHTERWDQQDVMLITYGDSIVNKEQIPLQTLHDFIAQKLNDTFSTIHILPFFPYSSDDGFSVIDFRAVNDQLGKWEDINRIADNSKLMVDLVINHVSRESLWFYDFVANQPPASDYFIDLPAETDVSMVTRPRSSPLLVPVNTHRGTHHLWATFSEDQIDLDFSNPNVLIEFIDILLFYIANGARLIRLDAIAFLWKELGTSCIHLDETHEIVKLFRTIIDHCFPDCILLTETNVPHDENLSYFGNADEAHMVYQFSLPPLILHSLNRGTSKYLSQWASDLPVLHADCTYLNFTASHDGIGLRALEGILPQHEIESLIESMQRFGGFVSMKANATGEDSPYEINISLFDAMQGTRRGTDQWQVNRFICSQAIMLGLQGIPAVYIHSIFATPNHLHGVELTGRTRSINRKQWQHDELISLLESSNTPNHEVFYELQRIIKLRKAEACFHPACSQEIIDISSGLFAFIRTEIKTGHQLFAIYNVTAVPQDITILGRPELSDEPRWYDLVTEKHLDNILPGIILQPYQFMWLVKE